MVEVAAVTDHSGGGGQSDVVSCTVLSLTPGPLIASRAKGRADVSFASQTLPVPMTPLVPGFQLAPLLVGIRRSASAGICSSSSFTAV